MGLYDTIEDRIYCPFCGHLSEMGDFQTKDLGCMMNLWTIKEIQKCNKIGREIRIYSQCRNCCKWIELIIEGEE